MDYENYEKVIYERGIKDFRDNLLKLYQQYPIDSALDNDGYYPYEEACEDLENFIIDVADKTMEGKVNE